MINTLNKKLSTLIEHFFKIEYSKDSHIKIVLVIILMCSQILSFTGKNILVKKLGKKSYKK